MPAVYPGWIGVGWAPELPMIRIALLVLLAGCARPAGPEAAVTATDLRDPGFDEVAALPFEVGRPFDLRLPAADDGHPVALSDLRGKPVLLHVFGSW